MNDHIDELLHRNLQNVFGEGDAARRRAAIDELYTEDCILEVPPGTFVGREAVDKFAGDLRATHPHFVYTPHGKATGLGPIGNHKAGAHGLKVHTTLGVTVEGVPLGILYQEIEARVDKLRGLTRNQKKQQIKKTAVWEKESMRWIRSLERTIEYCSSLDEGKKERSPLVVTVADRESDIFDLLVVAQHKKAAYLVRANQDRLVLDEEQRQLWGVLEAAEAAGCYTVTVQNKKKGKSKGAATRQAKLEVRYVEDVVLKPTRRKAEFRVEGWFWSITTTVMSRSMP